MYSKIELKRKINVRTLAVTAILSAVASVLMMFSFNVPFVPEFLKMDLSELPALIASFSMGPVSGATVCLIKNIVNLFLSHTGGAGELSNFLLGCMFVVPAGLIYKYKKSFKTAIIGSIAGAVIMALGSLLTNYYIAYPAYSLFIPIENILKMYQAILPGVDNLWEALFIFNVPFTFIKGLLSVIITMIVYKKISPIIKGTARL